MSSLFLYTSAQTQELDRIAIHEFGHPGLVLMERAGRFLFDQVMQHFSDHESVLILCGSGNNGGDGYVVARLLEEIGTEVRVIAVKQPETPDAQKMCRSFLDAGGNIGTPKDRNLFTGAGLVIDAMFGSGLSRPPEGDSAELIRTANSSRCPVVSVDLPSGLSGDTGRAFDPCIRADLTVTFIGRKVGLYTSDGPDYCGDIAFAGLGLEADIFGKISPAAELLKEGTLKSRAKNTHKGTYGHLMIAGGEVGMLGAVLLAGRTGLRGGAGLVTILSVPGHLDTTALAQPELMTRAFDPDQDEDARLPDCDVIVFGPGVRNSRWGQSLLSAVAESETEVLLDAGALHLLASAPDFRNNRVLTPHPGEAAILLGCTTADIQNDRLEAASEIQRRYGGVCVLKGTGTIIRSDSGTEICDRGNPGMASAGMGDVLSGLIGALIAQGLSPWDAARQGVWEHATAGDRARTLKGERALIASDLIDHLNP